MSSKTVGLVLVLVGSELLGIAMGQWYYRLFLNTMPQMALSTFNATTAHAAYITYGALAGFGIFIFTLLAIILSRFFRGSQPKSVAVNST